MCDGLNRGKQINCLTSGPVDEPTIKGRKYDRIRDRGLAKFTLVRTVPSRHNNALARTHGTTTRRSSETGRRVFPVCYPIKRMKYIPWLMDSLKPTGSNLLAWATKDSN